MINSCEEKRKGRGGWKAPKDLGGFETGTQVYQTKTGDIRVQGENVTKRAHWVTPGQSLEALKGARRGHKKKTGKLSPKSSLLEKKKKKTHSKRSQAGPEKECKSPGVIPLQREQKGAGWGKKISGTRQEDFTRIFSGGGVPGRAKKGDLPKGEGNKRGGEEEGGRGRERSRRKWNIGGGRRGEGGGGGGQ